MQGGKIIRRGGEWFVYITVERKVEERIPESVLAMDLGIRWIATTVNSSNPKPKFYGKITKTTGTVITHSYSKAGNYAIPQYT